MAQYVVIGLNPAVDVSVAVGPYRSLDRAGEADEELTRRGYNTEVVELARPEDLGYADWSEEG